MKVKYIGDYYKIRLFKNKIYKVIGIENGWYKIKGELNDTGYYPPELFEVVEE